MLYYISINNKNFKLIGINKLGLNFKMIKSNMLYKLLN